MILENALLIYTLMPAARSAAKQSMQIPRGELAAPEVRRALLPWRVTRADRSLPLGRVGVICARVAGVPSLGVPGTVLESPVHLAVHDGGHAVSGFHAAAR